MHLIDLENVQSWPSPLLEFLGKNYELFLGWETKTRDVSAQDYDAAIYAFREILRENHLIRGYHCTRLTEPEIEEILSNGMRLPDQALLHSRIDALLAAGELEETVASHLKEHNQAAEKNRAGMIWFCFFPPHRAGQMGLERLFRSWGGEALYNSHERDPVSGPALRNIGTPCLVEADVATASLAYHGGLDSKIIRRYLVSRGLVTEEPLDHEDRAEKPIPSEQISQIIRFPEDEFVRLTGCDSWTETLS